MLKTLNKMQQREILDIFINIHGLSKNNNKLDQKPLIGHRIFKSIYVIKNEFQNVLLQLMQEFVTIAYQDNTGSSSSIRIQQFNVLNQLQFLLKKLIKISKPKVRDSLEQLYDATEQIEKRNQEIRLKTVYCCGSIMSQQTEKLLYCHFCQRLCNYQKKNLHKDKNDQQQRNSSYHSIRHFDGVFKQLFVQPVELIDGITKLQLKEFMQRDNKTKVTIEDVRQYLKQLPNKKGAKFNKSDAYIMGILNEEQLKITDVEYNYIKTTFQQLIQILYKNASERKNTPNCISFIKNIIDLLYEEHFPQRHQEIVKRLHQQKENTKRRIQKMWQQIIEQVDIKQIQLKFVETVKTDPETYRIVNNITNCDLSSESSFENVYKDSYNYYQDNINNDLTFIDDNDDIDFFQTL